MCLTFLEVNSYRPYLFLNLLCWVADTQTTLPNGTPDNWIESNNNNDNDNKTSKNTLCTFQIEIIVKVSAPTLNNKMIATGTPRTSKRALAFEIQQNSSAIKEDILKNASNIK